MLEFLIASSITCSQAKDVISRVWIYQDLTDLVKEEIVTELKKASDCDWNAHVD
jgi:hypothetical protein